MESWKVPLADVTTFNFIQSSTPHTPIRIAEALTISRKSCRYLVPREAKLDELYRQLVTRELIRINSKPFFKKMFIYESKNKPFKYSFFQRQIPSNPTEVDSINALMQTREAEIFSTSQMNTFEAKKQAVDKLGEPTEQEKTIRENKYHEFMRGYAIEARPTITPSLAQLAKNSFKYYFFFILFFFKLLGRLK